MGERLRTGIVTVEVYARSTAVTATVTLTTDNVGETHIDGDEPRNFTDVFRYSIKTDDEGLVVNGEWVTRSGLRLDSVPQHHASRDGRQRKSLLGLRFSARRDWRRHRAQVE